MNSGHFLTKVFLLAQCKKTIKNVAQKRQKVLLCSVAPKLVHLIYYYSKKDESVQTESTHMVQLSSSTYMYKTNFVIQ